MKSGDIVLVKYPFTDFSSKKLRPALILLSEDEEEDFLLIFITSVKINKNQFNIPISKNGTGLHKDSILRLKKIMTVHKSLILGRIGSLTYKEFKNIKSKLREMLDI